MLKFLHNGFFGEVREEYLKVKEATWYEKPNNVVGVLVDPITGKLADKDTKNATIMYYIKGTEPNAKSLDEAIPTIKEKT